MCADFFFRETCCILSFLFVKLIHWFFLLAKLILFMELVTCRFVFVGFGTCCLLIFVFVKLVHWYFSSWNWFCSWNLLWANLCSLSLLYVDFSLRETCILIFLFAILILFIELVACWFFFGTGCMLFFSSSWNLYIYLSPCEPDFVHGTSLCWFFVGGTFCVLIFLRKTCCMLIYLFLKLTHCFCFSWNWFCSWNWLLAYFCSWNLSYADFCSWNLLCVDFSFRETCILFFLLVKMIFFSVNGIYDMLIFAHGTCCLLILFVKLAICWIFSSWKLYIDFSPLETDFAHGTCCVLRFLVELVAC